MQICCLVSITSLPRSQKIWISHMGLHFIEQRANRERKQQQLQWGRQWHPTSTLWTIQSRTYQLFCCLFDDAAHYPATTSWTWLAVRRGLLTAKVGIPSLVALPLSCGDCELLLALGGFVFCLPQRMSQIRTGKSGNGDSFQNWFWWHFRQISSSINAMHMTNSVHMFYAPTPLLIWEEKWDLWCSGLVKPLISLTANKDRLYKTRQFWGLQTSLEV